MWTLLFRYRTVIGLPTGVDNFVAKKHQMFLELRENLKKGQEHDNKRRVSHNAAIMRHS